jgi:conjugal transfer mating pair stabilization protein TraG
MRYAERYGGTSAAAYTMMDSELARQGLRPTRVFSDGTALPASFGGIREKYEQARNDGTFADDLGEVRQANDARVTRHRTGVPAAQPQELGPSLIRSDIQSARERVQGQTAGAAGSFDSKAQIVETPDGTLKSKKSLFAQTGKQIVGDADVTLDAAKDAVKNVLKRDK